MEGKMKTGFKDPIALKPGKKHKSPWDYRCPLYDERTSCYMNAGSHNGIGHRSPVGHTGPVKQRVSTLPYGRIETMQTSYVPPKQLDQEYIS